MASSPNGNRVGADLPPERWAQVEALFHRAAECGPEHRTVLLDEACSNDPELRREVEALLSSDQRAGGYVQGAVRSELDTIGFPLVGETISHYRVLEGLGGGGMGLVYRAEDIKLGRRVALKFLPEGSTRDPVALGRFEREARSASALEHPNICPIYEFGEHEGQPFLVMQLLEGQTLRELIAAAGRVKPPLELNRLLDLALEIADGLEAAHRRNIIHRDIKPANIFVTSQGQAKILDFGLAKLAPVGKAIRDPFGDYRRDDDEADTSPRESVRLASPDPFVSRTGTAIGTAGYMSPEQARGEKLDARTDLFSFGLVLYEMATGHRAFEGDTGPALHNAILTQTPAPVRQLNPQLPAKLGAIINKALQKNREARYQTVSEMRADLETLRHEIAPLDLRQRWILVSAAVVVLLITSSILWFVKRQPSSTQALPEIKFQKLTINSSDNPVTSGSISPNGKYLAYVDTQGLHVKDIETGATQGIPQPEALENDSVSWDMPDAAWFSDNTRFLANAHPAGEGSDAWSSRTTNIWSFSRLGGLPHKLRDRAYAGSVSPDGSLVPFGANAGKLGDREIWLMEPDGEQARKLSDTDENSWFGPLLWSPGGNRGFLAKTDTSGDTILFLDVRGGPPVTVFTPEEAKQVFPGLRGDLSWLPDGRMIYQVGDPASGFSSLQDTCNFWTMRFDVHTGKPVEKPKQLTNWTGFCISNANVTADGKRLAFLASSGGYGTTYMADVVAGRTRIVNKRHFTLDEADDAVTDWTDSKTVIIVHNRGDHYELYKQLLKMDTPEPIVTAAPGAVENAVASADGKWVIVQVWPVSGGPSALVPIMRVPLRGGLPEQLFQVREGSLISCAKAPSNLCTVAEQSDDRKQMIITAFDAVKGRGPEMARFEVDPNIDTSRYLQGHISPDGTHLLALRGQKGPIEIRSLRGGAAQVIHPKGVDNLLIVSWAADGKGLFVTNGTKDGSELFHMDLRGNTRLLWKSRSSERRCGAVPSPDGHHLAIYDSQKSANMWIMENF